MPVLLGGPGKIVLSLLIYLEMHDRMLNLKFTQADLAAEHGLNLESDRQLVDSQQWRLSRAFVTLTITS